MFIGKPSQGLFLKQLFRQLNSNFNGGYLVTPEVYLQDKTAVGMSFAAGSEILCIIHIRFIYELGNSRLLSRNSQKPTQRENVVTKYYPAPYYGSPRITSPCRKSKSTAPTHLPLHNASF